MDLWCDWACVEVQYALQLKQQEISDEVDKLKAENKVLSDRVRELEELLKAQQLPRG